MELVREQIQDLCLCQAGRSLARPCVGPLPKGQPGQKERPGNTDSIKSAEQAVVMKLIVHLVFPQDAGATFIRWQGSQYTRYAGNFICRQFHTMFPAAAHRVE